MKFVYILNGVNGSPSFLWRRKLIWVRGENKIEIHSVENSKMGRNINSNRLISMHRMAKERQEIKVQMLVVLSGKSIPGPDFPSAQTCHIT